jgi:glucose-1-phosphate adenylyltransferase
MNYDPLLQYHKQRQSDVTVCAVNAPLGRPFSPNAFITDGDGRVLESLEGPCALPNARYLMGLYVFKASVLMQRLAQDTRSFSSTHDLSQDVLPRMLESGDRVYAYDFQDYAANVGTVWAYWQANMDLLLPEPPLDLQDRCWHIHTRSEKGRPPVNICPSASVSNSLISDGCIIQGRVESSVLSSGVRVWEGALVRNSVILSDCEIKPGAIVDQAILDKNVVVGQNARVGADLSETVYLGYPHALAPGITLVGKNTPIPAGLRIGRDCVVCGDPTKDDFIIHNQRIGTLASQTWAISSDSRTLHTTAVLEGVGKR